MILENKQLLSPKRIHKQRILILDFGSQYTQLIARRIRECGVYSEIYAYDVPPEQIQAFAPAGIILSGGPESATNMATGRAPEIVFTLGCPVLGICYGMQIMAVQLGGAVMKADKQSEFGYAQVSISTPTMLLEGMQYSIRPDDALRLKFTTEEGDMLTHPVSLKAPTITPTPQNKFDSVVLDVWMSHGDQITGLPTGFISIASSKDCLLAGMADPVRHFYGLQFHPEVTQTTQGMRIFKQFVLTICGCEGLWTPHNILEDRLQFITTCVGNNKVLLGLSGGIDSSVVAALLHKAIGEQLTCVFVDTGLLRAQEGDQVMTLFNQQVGIKIIRINAEAQFLTALKGIVEPEEKRKIIGKLFIDIFQQESKKLSGIQWLAQGTIYPDVIESAASQTGKAHLIKSHHNVGGLPDKLPFSLLEPLRELFKDEVKKLGVVLGLPDDLLHRHPFPGPGLGVRILGQINKEYIDILRKADQIFIDMLKAHSLYDTVSQAFAVFLPVKSVGVAGDARKYSYVIALRAVISVDFMTAQAAELPYTFLKAVTRQILNTIPQVSRVVYDISDKPPATIEWE